MTEERRRTWEMGIRGELVALLLITLLAAAFRFYRLKEIPPGLHYDEGFKGVMARDLLTGAPLRIFFEGNMGEEPLAIYLVAAALGLLGQEPWVIRLPSAVVGTLTVPLLWWLGRELGGKGKRVLGLLAALILAILPWHVTMSRVGIEPVLTPFFAVLAFAALLRGMDGGRGRRRYAFFALGGLALGGSLYTYKAGYFTPLLAVLFVVYAILVERGFWRRHGRGLLLAACVAGLVVAPLAFYFATHPDSFLHRPASVTLTAAERAAAPPGQTVVGNLPAVLGMFFVRGDANPRSNLPGRPALDPFLGVLFVIGLGRAAVGFRRPRRGLPLLWLVVMVLPTLLTEYAPHYRRAIGAIPAVALLCADGGRGVGLWLGGLLRKAGLRPLFSAALALAFLGGGVVFSTASSVRAYFGDWATSPDLFYAYDVGLVQIADYISTLPLDEDVYLTPTSGEHYTLRFLVRRPFSSFDGRHGRLFPPPGRAATVIVILHEDRVTLPALQQARPDGNIVWSLADGFGRPYAVAYHLPAREDPAPPPERSVHFTFDGRILLLGYDLFPTSERSWDLTLYWQSLAPVEADYTVFSHLLGEHNPATAGPLWAGHDGQPNGGHFPTTAWQPGQTVLDVHPLTLPDDAPSGEYRLEVGLYLLATMERLPVRDAAGRDMPDRAVLLGTVQYAREP